MFSLRTLVCPDGICGRVRTFVVTRVPCSVVNSLFAHSTHTDASKGPAPPAESARVGPTPDIALPMSAWQRVPAQVSSHTHGKQRNIDGPPTIPRVTMHDPATNVPDAAPGTPPPRCDTALPPMNVFFNTPGACHVPGLPEERCRPMSREPALEVGGCPLTLSPLPSESWWEGPAPRQIPNSTQRLSGFICDSCMRLFTPARARD